MKKWIIMLLVGVALVLSACGGNESASDQAKDSGGDTITKAEEVFQNNCAYCHGSDLSGGAGPDLTEVGSRYSKEEITEIIINGKGAMPAGLVEGENADILASWLEKKK
ncbi:cytochrome c551 [Virgibacillus necropolis]|uniref:Cytochrome C551 n=1 Tax=Virgibacillus necropolis TaxID=163877 RepID=A0A221MAP9_9BACI|nr:cytochrome c [Virgibacillus necropolis]ASN04736.1 cytochrome C551 [Virgibacillus necropolis]